MGWCPALAVRWRTAYQVVMCSQQALRLQEARLALSQPPWWSALQVSFTLVEALLGNFLTNQRLVIICVSGLSI